jgi:hypothetical protein
MSKKKLSKRTYSCISILRNFFVNKPSQVSIYHQVQNLIQKKKVTTREERESKK